MSSQDSQSARDYNKHLHTALGSIVKVVLEIDYPTHYYIGRLAGVGTINNSICLENAQDDKRNKFSRIFLHGAKWISFTIEGEPFPMEALATRLRKVLPDEAIDISEDNTIHVLGGKVIISESGVEGRGPTAERIKKVYDAFVSEMPK